MMRVAIATLNGTTNLYIVTFYHDVHQSCSLQVVVQCSECNDYIDYAALVISLIKALVQTINDHLVLNQY